MKTVSVLALLACVSGAFGQSAGTFNPAAIQSLQTTPSAPDKPVKPNSPQQMIVELNSQVMRLQAEVVKLRAENATLMAATQPATQLAK